MIDDTCDLLYTYKGETTVIATVTGEFCPAAATRIARNWKTHAKALLTAYREIVDEATLNYRIEFDGLL